MTIGSKIKKIRKEKKLTQSELAKKINKGLRTVQKYESDDINVPIDILEDIANALDTTLLYLISDDNNSICIDFITNSMEDIFTKLYAISKNEDFMKNILTKKNHELSFFEKCLLNVYDYQEFDINIHLEILKLLNSNILQKNLNYSLTDLASNEYDLAYIITNIINSIKDSLRFINNSKLKNDILDK